MSSRKRGASGASSSSRSKARRVGGGDSDEDESMGGSAAAADDDKPMRSADDDDDDEEEEEEDESSESDGEIDSQIQAQDERNKAEHDAGIITKIELRDFMCHAKFTISLGRNVNFITGRNGSGKSAILAALMLCLGVKASDTHRGKRLSEMIRKGHEGSAFVRVTLLNEGDEAFRPDVYGNRITIQRQITKTTSNFKLYGADGKVHSTKKQDLVEMLDFLNVQIDNPCCILDQTSSKEFLKGSDSEKYNFFLRATDLEKLKRQHQEMLDERALQQARVVAAEEHLPKVEEELKRAKVALDQCQALGTLETKRTHVQLMYFWANVEKKEAEAEQVEQELAKMQKDIEVLDIKLKENDAALAENEKQQAAGLEAQDRRQRAVAEQEEAREELAAKVRGVEAPLQRATQSEHKSTGKLQKLRKHLQQQETKLRKEMESAKQRAEAADREKLERMEQLRARKEKAEEDLAAVEKEEDVEEQYFTLGDELKQLTQLKRKAQRNVQQLKTDIGQLESQGSNRLAKFGAKVPALMKLIEHNERKFERPPRLIGAAVGLPREHAKWARAIDGIVGREMKSMLVTSHNDRKLLNELRSQARCHAMEAPAVVQKFSDKKYAVNQVDKRWLTIERALEIEDPWVYNALVNMAKIEGQLLFDTKEKCEAAIIGGSDRGRAMPKGVTQGILPDGHRIFVRAGNLSDVQPPPGNRSPVFDDSESVADRIRACQKNLSQTEGELKVFVQDERGRQEKMRKLDQERLGQAERLKAARRAVRKATLDKEQLMQEDDGHSTQLDGMLAVKVDELKRDIEREEDTLAQSQAEVQEWTTKFEPLLAEREQFDREQPALDEMDGGGEAEALEKLVTERNGLRSRKDKLGKKTIQRRTKCREYEASLKKLSTEVTLAEGKATQFTKNNRAMGEGEGGTSAAAAAAAEDPGARVDTEGRSVDSLTTEVQELNQRIEKEKHRRGGVDVADVQRKWKHLDFQVSKRKTKIDKCKKKAKKAKDAIKSRHSVRLFLLRARSRCFPCALRSLPRRGSRARIVLLLLLLPLPSSSFFFFFLSLFSLRAHSDPSVFLFAGWLNAVQTMKGFQRFVGKMTTQRFSENMVQRKFDGRLKLDHKNKKLTMEVKKNDGDLASQACELSMLSGGERSYTQSAFLLALWKAIECPFRVLDEFDVFMDQLNRVTTLQNLQRMALEEKANNQFIFITPTDLSSIKADQVKVCVWKMKPPREDRHTSANQTTLD